MSHTSPAPTELRLFGRSLRARNRDEYSHDQLAQAIPAVNQLARAVQSLGNKLPNAARHALFFQPDADPELRETHVELGLAHLDMMRHAEPDLEYLKGVSRPTRQSFETAGNDEWLAQPAPPTP